MSSESVKVFEDPRAMRDWVWQCRRAGERVGVVPTMGALHQGHLSLVEAARSKCDRVVATIFVNPTQFAPHEDFSRYPRTWDSDLAGLARVGTDAVFAPRPEQMYPAGFSTYIDPPRVAEPWEGVCRPGHFRGVCTVVLKLFQIIPADVACFGAKDYQQALVIRTMVRDLDVGIEIDVRPTVREPDGLAMSSRNVYLSATDRQRALSISRSLAGVVSAYRQGERQRERLEGLLRAGLEGSMDSIDYAVVVDGETLECRAEVDEGSVALVAAKVGTTRLIDNRRLSQAE